MQKEVILTRIEKKYKNELEQIAKDNGLTTSALLRIIIRGVIRTNGNILKDLIGKGKTDQK